MACKVDMAKVATALSALAVSRLSKDGAHAVGGVAGLQLQIIGSSKDWILRFALFGRRRRMGFGPYPAVSLAAARELARKAHDLIRNGQDPIDDRQSRIDAQTASTSAGMTFKRAAEQFIAAHESGWSNAKHRLQWVSTIGTYALPVIGPLQIDQIEERHILQILEPIWKGKTETTSRPRALRRLSSVQAPHVQFRCISGSGICCSGAWVRKRVALAFTQARLSVFGDRHVRKFAACICAYPMKPMSNCAAMPR